MRSLLLAVAALLVLAAPAGAAPTRLGRSMSAPVVDSTAGRIVWQPDAGSLRLFELGARKPARPVGVPIGCRPTPHGLRGDRLLLSCAEGNRLLELRTGVAGAVPGWEAARAGASESIVLALGRVWGEGVLLAPQCCDATVFFRLDGTATDRTEGASNELPDLDAPQLWRRMCAPLERTRDDNDEDERSFLPYAYSPPLGLAHRAFDYRPLRVDRCGHERSLRLSRCRRACTAVHLGAGSIAWRERGRIRLYRGASRRRGHWRARRFGRLAEPVPTRRHVVVTAGRYGAYSVWSVRAPT
jgi:hypothetical protein